MSGQMALGVVILTGSLFAMTFADAMVKLVSSDLTIWQVFAARSVFAIPCLMAVLYFTGDRVSFKAPRWVVVRSVLLIAMWLCFYSGFLHLPMAVVAAAFYTNPIWTTLLSAYLLRESVLPTQWLGVALGFLGVALVLRPDSELFSAVVFLPLTAALAYSLAMVITRYKCREENPTVLVLNLHVAFIVTGIVASLLLEVVDIEATVRSDHPFLFDTWRVMGVSEWGLMAFLGVLSAAFFLGVARAYQIGPPQTMATVDYSYLIFAAMWGVVLFEEMPDSLTWIGVSLIIAAGLLSSGIFTARAASA